MSPKSVFENEGMIEKHLSHVQISPKLLRPGFGSSSGKGNEPGLTKVQHTTRKLANLSIPSIPSRFLTPVLKFDMHEG